MRPTNALRRVPVERLFFVGMLALLILFVLSLGYYLVRLPAGTYTSKLMVCRDQPSHPLPNLTIIACLASVIIGGFVRSQRTLRMRGVYAAPVQSTPRVVRIRSLIVLSVFFLFIIFLMVYETVALSNNHPPITCYIRSAYEVARLSTAIGACFFSALFGHWLL